MVLDNFLYFRKVEAEALQAEARESYMCYTPNTPFHCQPWLWQFIAQRRGRGYCVPTTHQWIIFRKGSGRTVAPNPGADYK